MPDILIRGLASGYDIEHLVRVFYPGARLRTGPCTRGALVYARMGKHRMAAGLRIDGTVTVQTAPLPAGDDKTQRMALSRLVYDLLRQRTGVRPPWGLLTGVRPVNLLRKRMAQLGEKAGEACFLDTYDVRPDKLAMAKGILRLQQPVLAKYGGPRDYSLYVSIPFCPSRCSYCSFVSRTTGREGHLVQPYLDKLEEELVFTAKVARECGLRLASVYIGGGTPTAISAPQLRHLLEVLEHHFAPASTAEYTVEAGRPDCTDREKLRLLKEFGVHRISINPQSLSDGVLQTIGRAHTAADILRCYDEARKAGHGSINMDLIAGLPGDTETGFAKTIDGILALAPENITIHSLTLKRASNLVIEGAAVDSAPARMMQAAYPRLAAAGYAPYYLYRQKASVENLENTGWCKPGAEGLYNICIMEEAHTILAVGAGASTKLVAKNGTVIKRRYNHKLPLEYIENFAEVLARKQGVMDFYACNLDSQTTG